MLLISILSHAQIYKIILAIIFTLPLSRVFIQFTAHLLIISVREKEKEGENICQLHIVNQSINQTQPRVHNKVSTVYHFSSQHSI
jgi:hypothetical protein